MPIFVAYDSADVWSRPHLWKLEPGGCPSVVAGVPPDAFSATGQLWGSPLYDWERLGIEGFGWWIDRVRETLKLVDVVRLDHFRGFAACWEVPPKDETAEHGTWVKAPGNALLRDDHGRAGRRASADRGRGPRHDHRRRARAARRLRPARHARAPVRLERRSARLHLPHEYVRNVVAYTGTHDNDTVVGWFAHRAGLARPRRSDASSNCLRYLGSDGAEIHWDFIRAAQMSVADVSIIPLQDLLGLGSTARMNTPGRARATGRGDSRRARSPTSSHSAARDDRTYGRSPSVAEVPVASGPDRRLPRGDPRAPQA